MLVRDHHIYQRVAALEKYVSVQRMRGVERIVAVLEDMVLQKRDHVEAAIAGALIRYNIPFQQQTQLPGVRLVAPTLAYTHPILPVHTSDPLEAIKPYRVLILVWLGRSKKRLIDAIEEYALHPGISAIVVVCMMPKQVVGQDVCRGKPIRAVHIPWPKEQKKRKSTRR